MALISTITEDSSVIIYCLLLCSSMNKIAYDIQVFLSKRDTKSSTRSETNDWIKPINVTKRIKPIHEMAWDWNKKDILFRKELIFRAVLMNETDEQTYIYFLPCLFVFLASSVLSLLFFCFFGCRELVEGSLSATVKKREGSCYFQKGEEHVSHDRGFYSLFPRLLILWMWGPSLLADCRWALDERMGSSRLKWFFFLLFLRNSSPS